MKKQSENVKRKRETVTPDPVGEVIPSDVIDPMVSVKPLPVEIFKNILDRLTDKHTLAQCMRVSTTFNSIVASSLYRSVSIDGKTKPFFASPRMSEELQKTRRTQTKALNLEYVEEIVYTLHQKRGCTPTSRARTWDSLTMRPRTLRIVNPPTEFNIENPACGCFDKMTPRKLVLPYFIYFWAFRGMEICTQMDTTIIFSSKSPVDDPTMELPLISSIPWIWRVKEPNPNRAVMMFYSNPEQEDGRGPDPRPWHYLRSRFFEEARYVGTPGDFLFVNIQSEVASAANDVDKKGKTDTDIADDLVRKAYLLHLSTSTARPFRVLKPEEEAQRVTFKFVTMKTCLTEYDWRGELSEDQARPWLELLEREKAAEGQVAEEEEAMNA